MVEYSLEPNRKQRREKIFRDNYRIESDDLIIEFPFHGEPSITDGKLKTLFHEHETHPGITAFRRKTIKCFDPSCPKDNIIWQDYKKRIPYLTDKGELVPDGWWKHGIESAEERIEFFQKMIYDELEELRLGPGESHGYKDRATNEEIDQIIAYYFPKRMPLESKKKLHNILWHMLIADQDLRVYHLAISPPQDQDYASQEAQKKLKAQANRLLIKSGAYGGFVTEHHARVKDRFNDPKSRYFKGMERDCDMVGFHFHFVGFGFFDYDAWKDSDWVLKNLSYNETEHKVIPVYSVRATVEYLLEHCSIISKKIDETVNGSLSCQTAFLTTTTPPPDIEIIDQSSNTFNDISLITDTDAETNEIEPPQSTVESGNSETATPQKTPRKFDAYWFIGALAKNRFRVPKKKTKCPLSDHEIEKKLEYRGTLYTYQNVKAPVSYVSSLEFLKSLEIGDSDIIDQKIALCKEGKLEISEEVAIEPEEYEKYFRKVQTGVDRILDGEDGFTSDKWKKPLEPELVEACLRRRLSDPMYAWFALPEHEYYTDPLNQTKPLAKFRLERNWVWWK